MESDRDRGTFDPELDLLPRQPTRRPAEPVAHYQRLVVNPFLVILSWVFVFALLRFALQNRESVVFLVAISQMFLSVFLVQYHCLDCGATGWLLRYRRHACAAVFARWQNPQARRSRGPTVKTQLVAWFVLLCAAALVIALALVVP